jgi:hypothetical protein
MNAIPWWCGFVFLALTPCGGGNLQHMDATPYAQLIERPKGDCPHSKIEQGIVNKHPDATLVVTVSEITGTNVQTTTQLVIKGAQTTYLGCKNLPSGQDAKREILDVRFD